MNESIESTSQFWPVVVYGAIVLTLVGAMLGLSYLLGQRHKERATGEPYEGVGGLFILACRAVLLKWPPV